jgi:hypothetical protein
MSMSLITFISNLTLKFWEPKEELNTSNKNTICTDNYDYEPDLEAGEGYYYTKCKNNNILYDLEMGDKRIIYE